MHCPWPPVNQPVLSMQPLYAVEKPLSAQQRFRLVEIAHETTRGDVRALAIAVLERDLSPPLIARGDLSDAAGRAP